MSVVTGAIFLGAGYLFYTHLQKGGDGRNAPGWYSNSIMDRKTEFMMDNNWAGLYKMFGTDADSTPSEQTRFDFEFAVPDPYNNRLYASTW